jgi:hypothetical protein
MPTGWQIFNYLIFLVFVYGITFPREFATEFYRRHHTKGFIILAVIAATWAWIL